jgi:hypothetical protein
MESKGVLKKKKFVDTNRAPKLEAVEKNNKFSAGAGKYKCAREQTF